MILEAVNLNLEVLSLNLEVVSLILKAVNLNLEVVSLNLETGHVTKVLAGVVSGVEHICRIVHCPGFVIWHKLLKCDLYIHNCGIW